MAQVKKFNTGGSVQKMKYGNIIKNGTTYEMTEESMKRLEQYIAAADPDIQQSLANDWKLLMSGQDVTIDTMANRRSTVPTDFSKGQLRRLGKDRATESKWHGATNSDIHKYNLATQYLGKFDPSKNDKIEETPQKDFWKSNKSIEYDIEDDGTKKYRGLSNTDEKKYYDNITAYLMGDDAFRAQYKDPGISNFETLDSWFKSLPNPEEFVKNLWNKIENGQELNSDESQFWTAIGMKFGDPKANPKYEEKVKSDEAQAAKQKAWDTFNVGNVWDDSEMNKDYFVYNPTTGTFTVKTPTLDGSSTGYHFNDDFVANIYGYDHLKGKVNFNGKWYNEGDLYNPESELYKMLDRKQYDYIKKNLRGEFDAANKVLKTNWSGVTYIPTNSDYLGPFNNGNYYYENIDYLTPTTMYDGDNIFNKDWNLIKAINMNGEPNILGVRPSMYILTDAYGRYIDPSGNYTDSSGKNLDTPYQIDPNLLKNIYSGQIKEEDQTLDFYSRLSTDKNDSYYNRYADEPIYMSDKKTPLMESWLGLDGNTENAFVYFHPNVGGIEDTTFENMPMDVYNVLHSKDFWDNYNNSQTSRNAKRRFATLIEKGENKMTEENWTALGINDENTINSIINYFTTNRRTGKKYTSSVQSNKSGGIIKYQTPSGPVGERKVDDKVVALAEQMNSPYEPAKLKDEFTPEDWLDISAVATDLIGFGVGYAPGWGDLGNLILSGVGATTLGAIADRKRVKHGALPKGTAFRNAAANIGTDIVSIVPIIGDAANFNNSLKRATRIAPIILSSAGAMATLQNFPDIVKSFKTLATNPSEFTTADLRNVSIGLQLVTGMTTRATRAYRDSNLAAKSATPKEQRYGFERTGTDGKKVRQNLDDTDIQALTEAKGQKNIDAVIDQIATKYKLSDSDKSALKLAGPTGMGFQHNKPFLWRNTVEDAPTQKESVGYYLTNPQKRAETLAKRSAEDFARAVDNGASGTRTARHMKLNKQEAPEGYELTKKGKNLWYESLERKKGKKSNSQQNNTSNQSNSGQNTSQQTAPRSTGYQNDPIYFQQGGILKASDNPELNPSVVIGKPNVSFYLPTSKSALPALPERKPYLEPKSSKFAEYAAVNNKEPDEVKNAREYISKLVDSDDYKKLSLTNPEIARTILSTQIEGVLANTKDENVRNQISKELESFRQTSLFKKGGIIKAQSGVNEIRLPKGSRPTEEEIIRIASRGNVKSYSKGNIDGIDIISFNKPLSERKLKRWLKRLPSGAYAYSRDEGDSTGSTPVTAQDPVTKTTSVTGGVTPGTTTTSAGSTVTTSVTKTPSDESSGQDNPLGQHPSGRGNWITGTGTNALMSAARLIHDRITNDIITTTKAKGIQEAADASMLSKQKSIPQRMQLTAGDASKAAANRMFQHLPPVNADYTKYAAQQRAGFDAANAMLAQSDREYSAQYSENLDKNIARQQMIADRNMQIEAQNRQIQAQKIAALSELYASRDAANRQSGANYMLEQQTKYEQDMQKAREARLARDRSDWTINAKQMVVDALKDDPVIASAYNTYITENPDSNLPIESWVATKPEFRDKVNAYTQKAHSWLADQQLTSELQYLPSWAKYKSGGKMRSASDQIAINREKANNQIRVNKYKSFDKNWEDQNKAVRKAIGKMHDRVYNILMKILS